MKRILALILALVMLSSVLVGCTNTPDDKVDTNDDLNNKIDDTQNNDNKDEENDEDKVFVPMTFEAGYGREDWTPDFEVALLGNADTRKTSKVNSKIYSSCTAVRDADGNTVLIFSVDVLSLYNETQASLRTAVSEATDIPYENIFLNATHTHFGPNPMSVPEVYALLEAACVNAAKTAIDDLAPCEIYTGTIITEGLTFVRRFVDKDNNGKLEPKKDEYETDPNDKLQLIKFERTDKKDIVLANWEAHVTTIGKDEISSDYVGAVRTRFEKNLCKDAYLSIQIGANGDSVAKDFVQGGTGEPFANPNWMGTSEYGKKLASYIATGVKSLKKHESDQGIKVATTNITLTVDHSKDNIAYKASEITAAYNSNRNLYEQLLKKSTIQSVYEASAILRRFERDKTEDMEVSAFSIGGIGFGVAPYEMFTQTGRNIREQSPYDFTFVMAYSNGFHFYIPVDYSFENGGYEVYSCLYVKGTAEQIQTAVLDLLNSCSNSKK